MKKKLTDPTGPRREFEKRAHEILAELQNDGRISNVELAARVNLSPAACLERVRKLHESGYIMGYTAQLNPQLLDVSGNAALNGVPVTVAAAPV